MLAGLEEGQHSKIGIKIKFTFLKDCPLLLAIDLHSLEEAEVLLHPEPLVADIELSIGLLLQVRKDFLLHSVLFVENPAHPVLEMILVHRIEPRFLLEIHVYRPALDVLALAEIQRMVCIFEPVSQGLA